MQKLYWLCSDSEYFEKEIIIVIHHNIFIKSMLGGKKLYWNFLNKEYFVKEIMIEIRDNINKIAGKTIVSPGLPLELENVWFKMLFIGLGTLNFKIPLMEKLVKASLVLG